MKICAIGLRGIPDIMGGIETHCEQLYPRLAKLDETLDIVVIGRRGYARSGRFGNVNVVSVWAPRAKALETLVHTPLAILYARLFLHPKVIHLHAIGPGFFAPFARLLGFRVVATHHAADYERPKWGWFGKRFLKAGEWMIVTFADEVVCVSSQIEKHLATRYPGGRERYVTIRNGAPSMSEDQRPRERVFGNLGVMAGAYILCVGRLDPTKGFHDLVDAFARARPRGLKLVIVGDAVGSEGYARKLKAAASGDIIFAGARNAADLRTLYRNAALFVHPSYMEGFAMVVLEAIGADTPLLVSDIPAHREVGLDEGNYYPCGNVAALAHVLARGSYDDLHCGRRTAILKENDWDTVARRHRDILVRPRRDRPREQTPVAP